MGPDPGQVASDAWCKYTKDCYDSPACDIAKYKNIEFVESPTSSIFLPEDAGEDICIIFPHAPNSVRHGKGKKLFCNDGCCAWEPPLLFSSKEAGSELNLCVNKNSAADEFGLVQGSLAFCAN